VPPLSITIATGEVPAGVRGSTSVKAPELGLMVNSDMVPSLWLATKRNLFDGCTITLDGPFPETKGDPRMVWNSPVLLIRSPTTLVCPPATYAKWGTVEELLPPPPHAISVETRTQAMTTAVFRHLERSV